MYQRPPRLNLLPEVIKNLLIINGLFFLASLVLGSSFGLDLGRQLGLYLPISEQFRPYQIVTHMFMHANLGHIFFNMFALWMFGYALENIWGSQKFLVYYLITGLGAAALHMGVTYWELQSLFNQLSPAEVSMIKNEGLSILEQNQNYMNKTMARANLLLNTTTVGASGAVFGILLAFGMMFPNQRIYLYFAIPVKAKYFVAAYGALELYNGISNDPGSNVAHFAHLGGMLFGYLLIKFWRSTNNNSPYG
jgi:membrane associated rhomboid family serine protease